MSDDVAKWLRRHKKNAPFYIVATEAISYFDHYENNQPVYISGNKYTVLFKDRSTGYIKIAQIQDGNYTRYGINTWAVLKGPDVTHMWGIDSLTLDDVTLMVDFYNGTAPDLPILNLDELKGLKH